jgi:hypothetical protein
MVQVPVELKSAPGAQIHRKRKTMVESFSPATLPGVLKSANRIESGQPTNLVQVMSCIGRHWQLGWNL